MLYCFHTKIFDLGIFWRALERKKMLVYFRQIWYILRPFGTFSGNMLYFPPVLVHCSKKNLATLQLGPTECTAQT
jgi:hypothetical protein